MIHILLIDDHPAVGAGTKALLEEDQEMIVTFVQTALEAFDLLAEKTFDVILVDLFMPGINGLEFTKQVLAKEPDAKIIIYTGFDINPHFNMLVQAGISGIVSKTATKEQLVLAITCCLQDQALIPISLFQELRRTDIRLPSSETEQSDEISINEREITILEKVAIGLSNKEIAAQLFMSRRTVEHHLTRIFRKLHVSSRAEAVVKAKQLGIIKFEQLLAQEEEEF